MQNAQNKTHTQKQKQSRDRHQKNAQELRGYNPKKGKNKSK